MTNLNWTQFSEKYSPIKNAFDKDPACDGHLFEDRSKLEGIKGDKIWTLLDNNDGSDMYITNGLRMINSLGYLVCLNPWNMGETIEVRLDESDIKQEENDK